VKLWGRKAATHTTQPIGFDAIDLFAGVGWDAAARELGMNVLGFDLDKDVVKLRRAESMPTVKVNLWEFLPSDLVLPFRGLIASPSCKKYSVAGKKEAHPELVRILAAVPLVAAGKPVQDVLKGMDPEAALVLAPLAWAVHHRPEWIALEQVKEVLPVWEAIADALRARGYSVDTGLLSAEQYGSGQQRVRAVLVANRTTEVTLPKPTHSTYYNRNPQKRDPGVKDFVTMAEVLGWDPRDRVGFARRADRADSVEIDGALYRARDLREAGLPAQTVTEKARSWQRFVAGDNTVEPQEALNPPKDSDNERPEWPYVRPATTVVASFRPDVIAAPGYRKPGDGPRQNAPGSVRVTVQETARLQSFPDDIDWSVLSKTAAHKLIGNAVDGCVARAVLLSAQGIDHTQEDQA